MDERRRDLDVRHNERARREMVARDRERTVEENLERALELVEAAQEVQRAFAAARSHPAAQ